MIATALQLIYELESQLFEGDFQILNAKRELQVKRGKSEYANSIFSISTEGSQFIFKQTKNQTLENLDFFENELNYYYCFSENANLKYFANRRQKYFIFPAYSSFKIPQVRDQLIVDKKLNETYLVDFLNKIGVVLQLFRNKSRTSIQKFKSKSTNSIQPKYQFFLRQYDKYLKTDNIEYLVNRNAILREAYDVKDEIVGILRSEALKAVMSGYSLEDSSLIHGDLSLRNILIDPIKPNENHLIDFEMVSFGDEFWDFVCLFESLNTIFFDRDAYSDIQEMRFKLLINLINQVHGKPLNKVEAGRLLKLLIINRLYVILNGDEINNKQIKSLHDTINNFLEVVDVICLQKLSGVQNFVFNTYY